MKGALNRSDMQRIQNNTKLLSDVLELNLTVADVPEHPNETFLTAVLHNTEIIRNAYMIHADTPETPQMPANTYQKMNDIEKYWMMCMAFYLITSIITVDQRYMPEMIPDYYYRKRGHIMGFTKKTWKIELQSILTADCLRWKMAAQIL